MRFSGAMESIWRWHLGQSGGRSPSPSSWEKVGWEPPFLSTVRIWWRFLSVGEGWIWRGRRGGGGSGVLLLTGLHCTSANKRQSQEGPMAGCPGISLGSPCLWTTGSMALLSSLATRQRWLSMWNPAGQRQTPRVIVMQLNNLICQQCWSSSVILAKQDTRQTLQYKMTTESLKCVLWMFPFLLCLFWRTGRLLRRLQYFCQYWQNCLRSNWFPLRLNYWQSLQPPVFSSMLAVCCLTLVSNSWFGWS